jgi:hypothetical protein
LRGWVFTATNSGVNCVKNGSINVISPPCPGLIYGQSLDATVRVNGRVVGCGPDSIYPTVARQMSTFSDNFTISTTANSKTVTFTSTLPHNLSSGDYVWVRASTGCAGNGDEKLNGLWVITYVSSTSFTYQINVKPTNSNTCQLGTVDCLKMCQIEVMALGSTGSCDDAPYTEVPVPYGVYMVWGSAGTPGTPTMDKTGFYTLNASNKCLSVCVSEDQSGCGTSNSSQIDGVHLTATCT